LNITCLIVDDEPLARNLMTEYVRKVGFLKLVKACSSPLEALEILRSTPVDLLFLDVQMPGLTGIAFLKSLQKKPHVILTTAYSEYAMEGYELDVADYLLKPITFERFLKAVDKVSTRLARPQESAPVEPSADYIFVKDGTKLVKIRWDDILYVEGLKDYVTIHTLQQKVVSLQRLKSLEEQLPGQKFMRVHNSFIISLNAIKAIQKDKVQIAEAWIPIGDTYRKAFKEFVEGRQLQ
jgi:two-component system, LytTR family, response regulator